MKQVIAFRVDSGQKIGLGHTMRCLTLAAALRDQGKDCLFVCRPGVGSSEDKIEAAGFRVLRLPPPATSSDISIGLMHGDFLPCSQAEDAANTIASLKPFQDIQVVIVDHYGIFLPWDQAITPIYRVFKIDDLADRKHLCHGILDQNFYLNMNERYQGLVPKSCTLLAGPKYALLRPEFVDVPIEFRNVGQTPQNILVSFGGQDTQGHSLTVIQDLLEKTVFNVNVMGGISDDSRDTWNNLKKKYKTRLKGPQYIKDPINALIGADIFIGSGGTTTWERFACGLPGIVFSIAKNQIRIAQDLNAAGLQSYGGEIERYSWDTLESMLESLKDPLLYWSIAQKIRFIVDGHGVERVLSAWGLF